MTQNQQIALMLDDARKESLKANQTIDQLNQANKELQAHLTKELESNNQLQQKI